MSDGISDGYRMAAEYDRREKKVQELGFLPIFDRDCSELRDAMARYLITRSDYINLVDDEKMAEKFPDRVENLKKQLDERRNNLRGHLRAMLGDLENKY